MSDMSIFVGCFIVVSIIAFIISVVRDVKVMRRQAPDGKVFKKEFADIVDDIYTAQDIGKFKFLYSFQNNITFKVRVEKNTPDGLEYKSIPVYKSYDIYINDELVCINHIFKEQHHFEFSGRRERDEVITLVKEAHKHAKEILQKSNKEMYERLGLVSKSFFEYSFNNDTEDI